MRPQEYQYITPVQFKDAETFVKRIRNAKKREFARQRLRFIVGYRKDEPEYPPREELSYMASQSVLLHLDEIFEV